MGLEIGQEGTFPQAREGPDSLLGRSEQRNRFIQTLWILEHTDGGLGPGVAGGCQGFFDLAEPGNVSAELIGHFLGVRRRAVGFEDSAQARARESVLLEDLRRLTEQPPPRLLLPLDFTRDRMGKLLHERAELIEELLAGDRSLCRGLFRFLEPRQVLDLVR